MSDDHSKIDAIKSSVYHHPSNKKCKINYFNLPRTIRYTEWDESEQIYKITTVEIMDEKAECSTHHVRLCYAEEQCFWQIGCHFGRVDKGYKPES